MGEFPQKDFYKQSEVCQYTDTQPYVLRFWESEFPQLNPERSGGGQPVYRREDLDLVCRIKELLYEEEFTLAGARQQLEDEQKAGKKKKKARPKGAAAKSSGASDGSAGKRSAQKTPRPQPAYETRAGGEHDEYEGDFGADDSAEDGNGRTLPFPSPEPESVPRQRYQDAIEEIDHLRLQVKDAEKARRKAESAVKASDARAEKHRVRALKAGARIEKLLDSLS